MTSLWLGSWLLTTGAWAEVPAAEQTSPVEDQASAEPAAEASPVWSEPVLRGAEQLSMSPEFVHGARVSLDHLFHRRYDDSLRSFSELDGAYPGTAVADIGEVLVLQSRMLENFSLEHDAAYREASDRAIDTLTAQAKVEGNEAWEHFMLAGLIGLKGIHEARLENYMSALKLAFEALRHVPDVRRHAPDFVDITLADGLYNYWRSALSSRYKFLPSFDDAREEGLAQVHQVEEEGIFLGPPARLSLTFSWWEEKDHEKALQTCKDNEVLYPDNAINLMLKGLTQLKLRRLDAAEKTFDRLLAVAPEHRRVHYYKGLLQLLRSEPEAALVALETYEEMPYLQDYQVADTHYRKGQAYLQLHAFEQAESEFKVSLKAKNTSRAKAALDALRKAKRDGTLEQLAGKKL